MITFEELDELRLKLKKKYTIFIIIGVIVAIPGLLISLMAETPPYLMIFGVIVVFFIAFLCTRNQAREYSLAFKQFFVKSSLDAIFTELNYQPENGIPREVIASTNMMCMGDRYSSNDLVTGRYKDIGFTQSDVHIEEEHESTDSDGNTRTNYVTIFKGRWMIFDFNKTFKADVQVAQKGFGNNKVSNWLSSEKFQKVEMESQEFNKNFKVYAQQPLDAFYILTPKVMEKIKSLDEKNEGKLLLCFIDNKLHVGIYNYEDSFEHGSVFKKINEDETRNKISTDIQKITMFVDELELDNDLFKKN